MTIEGFELIPKKEGQCAKQYSGKLVSHSKFVSTLSPPYERKVT